MYSIVFIILGVKIQHDSKIPKKVSKLCKSRWFIFKNVTLVVYCCIKYYVQLVYVAASFRSR